MDKDDKLSLNAVWNTFCEEFGEGSEEHEKSTSFEKSVPSTLKKTSVKSSIYKETEISQKKYYSHSANFNNLYQSRSSKNIRRDNRRSNEVNLQRENKSENAKISYKDSRKRNSNIVFIEKKSYVHQMKSISFLTLRDLMEKAPNEILLTISNKNSGFLLIFEEKNIGLEKMAYALIALGKSCSSDLKKNVSTMVTSVCSKTEFLLNSVQKYLVSLRVESVQSYHLESISYLITYLHKLQLIAPSSASEIISILLPLLRVICQKFLTSKELYGDVTKMLDEIYEQNEYYLKQYTPTEVKKASKKELMQLQEPPENYRSIPVLPNVDDIHSDSPFLRPNIVQGKYLNAEHYLDVQYRLLREDYVKPLRDGIAQYLRLKESGKSIKNCQDVRIYKDVHIVKQDFVHGSMVHIAEFCSETFSKIKWEYSKRFLSGSLLCLSSDDFQTMLFASVARRMPVELRKGLLLIRFETITDEIINLSPLRSFVVIETTAYFEAYRYNLKALHELNEEIMPFKKYIIDTEKSVSSPVYLTKSTTFDFRPLLLPLDEKFIHKTLSTGDLKHHATYEFPPDISNVAKSIHVLDNDNWPTESDLNLDQSQYLALKAAVTQEFAIIQGPPGTGKTYIGLRIVQLLLHNIGKWWRKANNSLPILVVCYTNHALDQFLEGLMLFTNKIVRIGGRGNNEEVAKFQLSNLKSNAIIKKEIPKHIRINMWGKNCDLKSFKADIDLIKHSVEKSMSVVLGEIELKPYIPSFQYESLKSIKYNPSVQLKDDGYLIHDWLGIRANSGFSNAFSIVEEKKITTIEPKINTDTDMEIDLDVESVGEADIEFIEAQRAIDSEDFANVSFDIGVQEKVDIIPDDGSEWKVQGGKKKLRQHIKKCLKYSQALEDSSAKKIKNIWNLELHFRWQLYKFWLQKYIEAKQAECVHLQLQLRQLSQEICEIRIEEDMFILQDAHIVGMTTTGAAKYRDLLIRLNPQILIVEEAAEILESHIITSLAPKTQHVILIGDHQQLRPSPTVHMLSVHYDLDISLFERMLRNNMDCFRLTIQHRMRPDIADLIVPHIYADLKNHDSVTKYENIKGISKNVFFVAHKYNELQERDSKSKVNEHEAKFLIKLCKYIVLQGYDPSQITVLTTYSGQLFVLKRLVTDVLRKVKFTVVDNFQGEENDIILISFVRSNDEGEIGFLKIANRVCVALSRARKGLYCIGNFELLAEKSDLWKNIVKTLQQKQCIGPSLQLMCQNHPGVCNVVANENDFESVPEGGCNRTCEYRLNCGHTCSMMCHPYDMAHESVRCQKLCTKFCSEGHQCNKKCFQKCGNCVYMVDKKMYNCGHTIKVQCHMQNNNISCYEKCNKKLPCGHACANQCGKLCTLVCEEVIKIKSPICGHDVSVACFNKNDVRNLNEKCIQSCASILECGHICKGTCKKCHQGRLHIQCSQPCNRILVCGHECKSRCSKSCPPCTHPCENKCTHSKCPKACGEPCNKCVEPCEWACIHQKCSRSCGELCDRIPCNQSCPESLPCGHLCIGFCGEPCPEECRICNEQKVTEILFGTEDDENARYVCLEDCKHILEISGLNQWMKTNTDDNIQIQMKSCPKCNTVIRTNLRFGNIVKTCLQNIEKVKQITFGNIDKNKKMQHDLLMLVNDLDTNDTELLDALSVWKNVLASKTNRSIQEITTMENMLRVFSELIPAVNHHKTTSIVQNFEVQENMNTLIEFFFNSKKWLVEFIKNEFLTASEQQLQQLTWEIHRLKLSTQLIKYVQEHRVPANNPDFGSIITCLMHYAPFCENDVKTFSNSFKSLAKVCGSSVINISDVEKQSILKAMNLTKGHWYQCPNGHVYCITECGGAMEVGRCNECNEVIGGRNHALLRTNQVATDMDGATYAAWSEAMNMRNFDRL